MDAFHAYKIYIALKNHFNQPSYDYIKYNGKTNVTQNSFMKRRDKGFFSKASRKYGGDIKDYFIANMIKDPDKWIGDYNEENYIDWMKRRDSLSYIFKNELDGGDFNKLFDIADNNHPIILKRYLASAISLETLVILDNLVGFTKEFDKKMEDDFIWPSISTLIKKYKVFIKVDRDKYRGILISQFS
jgi:hypothetical protein